MRMASLARRAALCAARRAAAAAASPGAAAAAAGRTALHGARHHCPAAAATAAARRFLSTSLQRGFAADAEGQDDAGFSEADEREPSERVVALADQIAELNLIEVADLTKVRGAM